jgi:radical SAM superfamily enzyme YgiQ (UPF0313 family)
MKKILLINPAYNRFDSKIVNSTGKIPLGLIILQDIFKKNDLVCDILDLNFRKELLLKVKTYDELVNELSILGNYDVFGLTSFSNSFINTILLSKAIKKKFEDRIVFMGGAHVSSIATKILDDFEFVDFVACYEGEIFARRFSEYLKNAYCFDDIPNIVYRKDKKIIKNQIVELLPEDELPMLPNTFEIIGYDKVQLKGKSISIEGGRGCPFSCIFCSTKLFWQRKSRIKSTTAILDEMDILNKKLGIESFKIVHDLFTLNKKKLNEFVTLISKKNYTWNCSARVDTLDFDMLDKMYKSGCQDIFFGVETGNQELQKAINKNLKLEELDKMVMFCNERNYTITLSFILGFPFDSRQTVSDTLSLILRYGSLNNVKISTGILSPEIDTEIFKKYGEMILFDENYLKINYDYVQIEESEELNLIQKYSQYFSHFYYIPNGEFSIFALDFLLKVIRYILSNYPKTFLGMVSIEEINLVDLLEKIIEDKFKDMSFEELKNSLAKFELKLRNYVNNTSSETIKEIYKFESELKKMKKEALNSDGLSRKFRTKLNLLETNFEIDEIEEEYLIKINIANKRLRRVNIEIVRSDIY